MITVLAGGVGAARFLQGLLAVHRPSDITIISNVGDDAEFFGLHVSPDIDIVLYHLAGLSDEERGFGIKDDTFNVIDAISRYGYDTWFRLGDRDLATCITRTDLLRRGRTLSEATAEIASALLVPARIIPVTDDRLRTKIRTDEGLLDFQEYFVHRRTEGHLREVVFDGADKAQPAPGVIEAITEASAVIITPSNPLVSIGPILVGARHSRRAHGDAGARSSPSALSSAGRRSRARPTACCATRAWKPTQSRSRSIYADFLDVLVIDDVDAALKPEIDALGVEVVVTDTIMGSMEKKSALARTVLKAASA